MAAGFELSATWGQDADGKLHLAGTIPRKAGIYLFAIGETVHYVGKADKSLHSRMGAYVRAVRRMVRRRPVHDGIVAAMSDGAALTSIPSAESSRDFENVRACP
jgi:hypothetical protein